MGGLAVIFLIGLYFVLTVVAIAKAKPVWAKGLVLLAALLIPTADAVYGRYKLKQMCAAEAGLKVYRVAHGVEGFMASTADEDSLRKYGFQFMEGGRPHHYYRFSKQNGQIVIEENVNPKSQYRLRNNDYGERDTYLHHQYLIEDIKTGEILATDTQFTFNGGWAERFLARFSDAGGGNVAWCSHNPDILVRIFNDTMIGSGGNDIFISDVGSDTMVGGTGNDTYQLDWYRGNNIYVSGYTKADGTYIAGYAHAIEPDTIIETGSDINTIRLPMGLDFSGLVYERRGDDLYLAVQGKRNIDFSNLQDFTEMGVPTPGALLVKDYYLGTQQWQVQITSGNVMSMSDLLQQLSQPAVDFVQEAYDDWLVSARLAILNDFNVTPYNQIGDNQLRTNGPHSSDTQAIEFVDTYSDAVNIYRYEMPYRLEYTPNGTYTVEVNTRVYSSSLQSSYNSGLSSQTEYVPAWIPIYNYGNLDSSGNPTIIGSYLPAVWGSYGGTPTNSSTALPYRYTHTQ